MGARPPALEVIGNKRLRLVQRQVRAESVEGEQELGQGAVMGDVG